MFCVLDLETTGLPKKDVPKLHPTQPHIIQAAWRVYDKELKLRSTFSTLVNPKAGDGVEPGAEAVHGISQIEVEAHGISTLAMLHVLRDQLDTCRHLITYGPKFDLFMLEREALRMRNVESPSEIRWLRRPGLRKHDILQAMADINLDDPGRWRPLSVVYEATFGEPLAHAHDALADVDATHRLFWHLVGKGAIQI